MWPKFFSTWRRTPRSIEGAPEEDPRIAPALELERRLYESAVASVDQTFAKEGLVATFLTSGAASIQAFAQIATSVGIRATWSCLGLFILSMALLGVSGYQFTRVLRGREVQDLSGADEFMNTDPASSKREADLKLIAEYRQARQNHIELVKHRLRSLLWAIGWLGASMLVSFASVLIAVLSVAIHKTDGIRPSQSASVIRPTRERAPKPPYNRDMRPNENPKPKPIVLPKPGSGTTMIKGGGGNGR